MALMTNYGFFNYNADTDDDMYKYSAEEFSTVIGSIAGDGVNYKYGNRFSTTMNGLNAAVSIGACFIKGHYGWTTGTTTVALSAGGSTARHDYICAHLDESNRCMELVAVEGTASAYPDVDNTYLVLYKADVAGSTVTLTDMRTYNYGSSNLPAANVIYATTAPQAVIEGAIWLKPAQ